MSTPSRARKSLTLAFAITLVVAFLLVVRDATFMLGTKSNATFTTVRPAFVPPGGAPVAQPAPPVPPIPLAE